MTGKFWYFGIEVEFMRELGDETEFETGLTQEKLSRDKGTFWSFLALVCEKRGAPG